MDATTQTAPAAAAGNSNPAVGADGSANKSSNLWVKLTKDVGTSKAGEAYMCDVDTTKAFLVKQGFATDIPNPVGDGLGDTFSKAVSGVVDTLVKSVDDRLKQFSDQTAKSLEKFSIPGGTSFAVPKTPEIPGGNVAKIVLSLVATKGITSEAARWCEKQFGDGLVAKALAAGVGSAGGFTVPETLSADFIELLRPASVVRRMGPASVPLVNGTAVIPRMTAGSTASYIGENTNITKTEPTFGQMKLVERTLAALVPISNDLLRNSNQQVQQLVVNDLVQGMATTFDSASIRSDGTGNQPKGMRYQAQSGNIIAANGTINVANVKNDLGKLMLALMNANTRMINPGWLLAPRTVVYLTNLVDSNNTQVFPELSTPNPTLRGYKFGVTTNIPVNLGGGSDESEVYFVDFADLIVADDPRFDIEVSNTAAYHDGSNVVAAFSLNQTVVRVIQRHDVGLRYYGSAAILTACKWTP